MHSSSRVHGPVPVLDVPHLVLQPVDAESSLPPVDPVVQVAVAVVGFGGTPVVPGGGDGGDGGDGGRGGSVRGGSPDSVPSSISMSTNKTRGPHAMSITHAPAIPSRRTSQAYRGIDLLRGLARQRGAALGGLGVGVLDLHLVEHRDPTVAPLPQLDVREAAAVGIAADEQV